MKIYKSIMLEADALKTQFNMTEYKLLLPEYDKNLAIVNSCEKELFKLGTKISDIIYLYQHEAEYVETILEIEMGQTLIQAKMDFDLSKNLDEIGHKIDKIILPYDFKFRYRRLYEDNRIVINIESKINNDAINRCCEIWKYWRGELEKRGTHPDNLLDL